MTVTKPEPNSIKVTLGYIRRGVIKRLAKKETRSESSMVVVLVDEALAARGISVEEDEE